MKFVRVIPCLDVAEGRVVKGTNFVDLRDAGDPVELAMRYVEQGADEIAFLDITATPEGRGATVDLMHRVAEVVPVPFTVAGGIRSVRDARKILDAGANKVSVATAAVEHPELLSDLANEIGTESLVVGIDARLNEAANGSRYEVVTNGGKKFTGLDAIQWAIQAEELGAGEILLTSLDRDGTNEGFDLELTKAVAEAVSIPVIASGGVGTVEHLVDGVLVGKAAAVLAASIFHFGGVTVREAKEALAKRGVPVQLG